MKWEKMNEEKQTKVNLTTIIYILIIAILIIIIGSMYFYYNYKLNEKESSNENKDNTVINNDISISDITKENYIYTCKIYENHFLDQYAELKFYQNKTFEAHIYKYNIQDAIVPEPYNCSGIYEIKGNQITCSVKEVTHEEYNAYAQRVELVFEYNKNEDTMQLIYSSTNKIQAYNSIDTNSIEEIQLSILEENNIFKGYISDQESDSNKEQYFDFPAYYALNGNEDNATIFVWRKLCKHF